MATRFERIRAEGEKKKLPFYREICSALLTEILYLYLRQDQAVAPIEHDQILQRALACIRIEYCRPLSIVEIARAAGCTDRTLRHHFHHGLQTRPMAFVQRYRINEAKQLIQGSDYTLKEIAEQVGFQTVHHFTRIFTALEGRAPGDWRREYLEGIRKNVYINPHFENRNVTVGREDGPASGVKRKKA